MYAGDEHLLGALDAGASAFVSKDAPADQVVAAARHAAAVAALVHRRRAGRGDAAAQRPVRARRSASASRRCWACWPRGSRVGARSAKRLFVSESTAKTHVAKVYEKLGAANRSQALMRAVELGLVGGRGDGG